MSEIANTIYDMPDLRMGGEGPLRIIMNERDDNIKTDLDAEREAEIRSIPSELLNETMASLGINAGDDVLLDGEKIGSVSIDDAGYCFAICDKGKLKKGDMITINGRPAEVLNDNNMISLIGVGPEISVVGNNLYDVKPIPPTSIDININDYGPREIPTDLDQQIPNISIDNISQQNLTKENIINIWSAGKMSKDQIISFFNSVKDKPDIDEQQKKLLVLLYIGLTNPWDDSDKTNQSFNALVDLQKELKIKEPDGKFGVNTFIALKNRFGYNNKSERNNNKGVVVNSPENTEIKNIITSNYSDVLNIINRGIGERELTFNYNSKVSFKVNKNICVLTTKGKSYELKKTEHNRKFQLNDDYLEFLPTGIYVRGKNNKVHVYRDTGDIFSGVFEGNNYKKGTLSYKNGGSFEGSFDENWKEKYGIRKFRSGTRLEYNGARNYYLDISKSGEIHYSSRFNYGPITPYVQTKPLKMNLNKSNNIIKLVGETWIIEINTQTGQGKEIKKSNNYSNDLPKERCNLICEQLRNK